MPDVDVLLVGGGVASAGCADELRARGFDGSILLCGRELDPPYHRPPCSKEYLRGTGSREDALVRSAEGWSELGVEVRTRVSVLRLDPEKRTARLSDRSEIGWGMALLATGANVRRVPVDGSQLDGIHYLRALGNADAIRRDAAGAERAVLVGGSYIGCEVAASLVDLGVGCTIVMQEPVVLSRHFGERAGRWVQERLEARGVRVVGEAALERFTGADERVEAVVLADGTALPADLVVMGTGAVPDVTLARASGIELGETGGIRCDAQLRTSAAGVWAAGDVCEYASEVHGRRLRVEHEDVAFAQGRTAARNMLGAGESHRVVPWFWSDLGDWARLEYVGPADDWDDEEIRGSLDGEEWAILYRRDGRVVAGLSCGRPDDLEEARAALTAER